MYSRIDKIIKNLLKSLVIMIVLFITMFSYNFFMEGRSVNGGYEEHLEFSDIDNDSREYDIANWAVRNGIVRGYLDGSFRPDELVSEKQMMIMLYSYFGLGDLKYVTTMIDESNIEVKNVGEVYGKLRDAGIFVDGTNVFDGSVVKREDPVTVREVLLNFSKFFGDDTTSYKDFKILKSRVNSLKVSNDDLDVNVKKIDFLKMMYVLDNERADYNNEIVVNKSLNLSNRFWFVDREGVFTYVMRDVETGVLVALDQLEDGYGLSVLNSGSTPYEYFGYSVITYGDAGVNSVFDTENYVALGGTSNIYTKINGDSLEMVVLVLGDQVVEIPLGDLKVPKGLKTDKDGVFDGEGNKLDYKEYEYVIQHMYSK